MIFSNCKTKKNYLGHIFPQWFTLTQLIARIKMCEEPYLDI